MQAYERLGKMWISATDPLDHSTINIRVDSVRQEAFSPFLAAAAVVTFSTVRGELTLEQLESSTPQPYSTEDGEREVILLTDFGDGANPVVLFDRIAPGIIQIACQRRKPMSYQAYVKHMSLKRLGDALFTDRETGVSPTGRLAVWNVTFVRHYGLVNDLFAVTDSQALYLFGQMARGDTLPGGAYEFPEGFRLKAPVLHDSFLAMQHAVLEAAIENDELAKVKQYLIQ